MATPQLPMADNCEPPVETAYWPQAGKYGLQASGRRCQLQSGWQRLAAASANDFPGHAQRMQDELIVEAELGGIEDRLPSVHHIRIAGDAPRFVANDAITMLAGGVSGVLIAMKPRV